MIGELTDTDRAILAIEARMWRYAGAKEQAIAEQTGMRPTAYYQRLNVLLDTRAALDHDPLTVNRLRRWRQQRRDPIASPPTSLRGAS